MTDQLKPTQADRDAAADSYVADYPKREDTNFTLRIRAGKCDRASRVQAFTRHRLSHSGNAERESGEEYCPSCLCDLCQRRNQDVSIKATLAEDSDARCWSCSCGWIGCYTNADLAEYGEPSECQSCYRERLSECDPARASLSASGAAIEQVAPSHKLGDVERVARALWVHEKGAYVRDPGAV